MKVKEGANGFDIFFERPFDFVILTMILLNSDLETVCSTVSTVFKHVEIKVETMLNEFKSV